MALPCSWANRVNRSLNQKRRLSLISQGSIERNDLADTFKEIFPGGPKKRSKDANDGETNKKKRAPPEKIKRFAEIASQFMLPEWMIDIPENFGSDWYLCSIPTGPHCLITISNGWTTVYKCDGRALFRRPFRSALQRTAHGLTVLDGVFSEENRVFFVKDVLLWNSVSLSDSAAECRLWWAKVRIEDAAAQTASAENEFALRFVRFEPVSAESLAKAYEERGALGAWDAIHFIHKDSRYVPGPNPLLLKWKDRSSGYFIDNVIGPLAARLQIGPNLSLLTYDGFQLENTFNDTGQDLDEDAKVGDIVKVQCEDLKVREIVNENVGFSVELSGITFHSTSSRATAQILSKIMFQYLARKGKTLSIDHLKTALINSN